MTRFLSPLLLSSALMAEPAIRPYATGTVDYFSVLDGGLRSGDSVMGLLEIGVEADLGWKDTTLTLSAFSGHGTDFTARFAGDAGVVSNIYSPYDFNIFHIALQKNFGESFLKLGQIAVDDDFMGSDAAGLFINSTFGPLNTQSLNTAAPIFPLAAPGIVYHHAANDDFTFTFGAYAGDLGGDDLNDRGFDWRLGGSAGYAFFAEGAWQASQDTTAKLGGYYHSGDDLGAVYGIIDHSLTDNISAFARASVVTEKDRATASTYFDGGIVFHETLGLGVSHTDFADDYLATTPGVSSSETIIELTYLIALNDHFTLQPDVQYILNAHEANRDTLVAGLRGQFNF